MSFDLIWWSKTIWQRRTFLGRFQSGWGQSIFLVYFAEFLTLCFPNMRIPCKLSIIRSDVESSSFEAINACKRSCSRPGSVWWFSFFCRDAFSSLAWCSSWSIGRDSWKLGTDNGFLTILDSCFWGYELVWKGRKSKRRRQAIIKDQGQGDLEDMIMHGKIGLFDLSFRQFSRDEIMIFSRSWIFPWIFFKSHPVQ